MRDCVGPESSFDLLEWYVRVLAQVPVRRQRSGRVAGQHAVVVEEDSPYHHSMGSSVRQPRRLTLKVAGGPD